MSGTEGRGHAPRLPDPPRVFGPPPRAAKFFPTNSLRFDKPCTETDFESEPIPSSTLAPSAKLCYHVGMQFVIDEWAQWASVLRDDDRIIRPNFDDAYLDAIALGAGFY